MRIIILLIFFLKAAHAEAQALPSNTKKINEAKKSNIGSEKLKPLSPPDLQVTECSLVSITRNDSVKKINIQVSIKVKNTGPIKAGASTLAAYYKSPAGSGAKKQITVTLPVGDIYPNQYFSSVYIFQAPVADFRPGSHFDFWVKADARNHVEESNENNNESEVIQITVPAR
jgi:CARDB